MGLQDYDLYALKSYSFTVRKTNSFFSLPTVLLTISVFVISVLINFNTISHLWLPRDQLIITSSTSVEIPIAFTSTLACLKAVDPANKDKVLFYREDMSPLTFPVVTQEELSANYPQVFRQIGSSSYCVDLKGFTFASGIDMLLLGIKGPTGILYLKGTTLNQIIFGTESSLIVFNSTSNQRISHIYPKYLKCTISDRLYLNYQPQVINTIRSDQYTSAPITDSTLPAEYSFFKIVLNDGSLVSSNYQNGNMQVTTIYRKNLGEIFGALLSWVSIFALLIGFIAGPLMDKTLNLLTAESLFHLEPYLQNPSLFKFLIASLKEGIFPKEDRYVKMCHQVEKMKDVSTIVKLQTLFSRLIPRSRTRPSQELIASEHNFNQVAKTQVGVDLFTDTADCKPLALDVSEDEKEENCLLKLKRQVLYLMDEGSDAVSVTYKNGGIGSKKSFCVTLLAVVGLLTLLLVFGLLKSEATIDRFNTEDFQQNITLPGYTFIFGCFSNNPVLVTLLDSNYKKIKTIPVVTGQECRDHIPSSFSLPQSIYLYSCISSEIQLSISETSSQTTYLNFVSSSQYLLFPVISKNKYFKSIETALTFGANTPTDSMFYSMSILKININSPDDTFETFRISPRLYQPSAIVNTVGIVIKLSSEVTNIQETNPSFFNAVSNVWTFTVVCFTIIVMKLTKYINLQQKQESRSPEKAEFRDSICIFLARMNGLLHGRHRPELEHIKHYVKEPLPLD